MFTGQIHATGEEDDTQQIRKTLFQRCGSEDAGSVTHGSIASAAMSESITASSVENSQAATKVTSSDQSSPNSTTSRTRSASVTVFRLLFPSLLWQSRQQTAPVPAVVASDFSPLYHPVPTTHVPVPCRTLPEYVLSAWPTKKPLIVSTPF